VDEETDESEPLEMHFYPSLFAVWRRTLQNNISLLYEGGGCASKI
jgi:hypothetical protein